MPTNKNKVVVVALAISASGGCGNNMSRSIHCAWPLAAALFLITPAHAETWSQKVDRHFSLLDTDDDGRISRTEAAAHPPLARHFRAMDKNKDGGLSKYELANYRVAPRNRALANADAAQDNLKPTGRKE